MIFFGNPDTANSVSRPTFYSTMGTALSILHASDPAMVHKVVLKIAIMSMLKNIVATVEPHAPRAHAARAAPTLTTCHR